MRKLFLVTLACTLCFIAPHIITPFLSFQVRHLGGDRFLASGIFSVAAVASLLVSPFWGRLSDVCGRRKMLLLSGVLTSLAQIWFGYAGSLTSLFLARAFGGLVSGWMVVASAYVADITDEKTRTFGMAMVGVAIGFGFMAGAFLQSALAFLGLQTLCLLSAAVNATAVGLVFFLPMPSTLYKVKTAPWNVFLRKDVLVLLLMYGGVYFAFVGFEGVFAVWGMDQLKFKASDIGFYMGVMGFVMLVVQVAIRWLIRIWDERWLSMAALVVLLLSVLSFPFGPSRDALYGIVGAMSAAVGLASPLLQAFISRRVNPEDMGSAMGVAHSVSLLAMALAPLCMGWLYAHSGAWAAFGLSAVMVLLTMVGGFICFVRWRLFHAHINRSHVYGSSRAG